MSSKRISSLSRAISRPNANKAIERLRADLDMLIARSPLVGVDGMSKDYMCHEMDRTIAQACVSQALLSVLNLYK